jgi:hypothetical protein
MPNATRKEKILSRDGKVDSERKNFFPIQLKVFYSLLGIVCIFYFYLIEKI